MLEKIDLTKVFGAARNRGYDSVELYAESREETDIFLKGRLQETRLNSQSGVSISLSNGERNLHFFTNDISTEGVLSLVEETPSFAFSQTPLENRASSLQLKDQVQHLKTALRKSGANLDDALCPTLSYEGVVRHFEVCNAPDVIVSGHEEKAASQWKFGIRGGNEARIVTDSFARSSIKNFWEEFGETSLVPSLPHSWFNPWPSPMGKLAVIWKPKAFAQLLLPFLRAFEGDLVLKKMSILHQIEKAVPLHFRMQDTPDLKLSQWDHEGSPLSTTTLFAEGTAQTVACDRTVAHRLSIPLTGHARRESFLSPSCIGLWNAHLVPAKEEEALFHQLQRGIGIVDIDILDFNPFSGTIQIRVNDSFLIHHGEEGEALKPIEIETSLLSLLSSMTHFGKEIFRFGCNIKKGTQEILTEVNVPMALSPELDYPGEVSPNHYW